MSKILSVRAMDRNTPKRDKYTSLRQGYNEPGYTDLRLVDGVEGVDSWNTRKSQAQDMAARLKPVARSARQYKLAEKMDRCAVSLSYGRDPATGKLRVMRAMRCGQKWCPVCSKARAEDMKKRFIAALPIIKERHPTAKWLMLTLTVKNPKIEDLRGTIAAMNKAWQRLIQRKDWPALGFVRATEITAHDPARYAKGGAGKGPAPGECHPHFHALLLVNSGYFKKTYVTQAEWAERWQNCARLDYMPVVDVRAAKEKVTAEGEILQEAHAAALEVLKYSVKPSDLLETPALDMARILEQIDRLRFVATGGVIKDILGELDDDEPEQKELELEPAFTSDWRAQSWLYAKRNGSQKG